MPMQEAILAAIKELILPELQSIKQDLVEVKASLVLTNKRLDDMNAHLVDQSRRIDAVHADLAARIEGVRSELTDRIESVRSELIGHTNAVRSELIGHTNAARSELIGHTNAVRSELTGLIFEINKRLDRLYEVIVRREEHDKLDVRLTRLEQEVGEIRKRLAA